MRRRKLKREPRPYYRIPWSDVIRGAAADLRREGKTYRAIAEELEQTFSGFRDGTYPKPDAATIRRVCLAQGVVQS